MPSPGKPRLAVWKFASCDGCQLTVLNLEDELLALADRIEIANFREASSALVDGPYDLSLVEGSITTPQDAERIRDVRAQSRVLVTLGACATAGGIQALRNFAPIDDFRRAVYAHPEFIQTLATSTPIAEHVPVDLELRGCPISPRQLRELFSAFLGHRAPDLPSESVCQECKRRGNVCVVVAKGIPCLGPVTQTGCGALCPSYQRGCYGCFGPQGSPNIPSMLAHLMALGMTPPEVTRVFRTFNAGSPSFRAASEAASGLPGAP